MAPSCDHHGQQGIQKQLAIARCGTVDERLAFVELVARQVAYLQGQPRRKRSKHVTSLERALQGCQFVTGTRSTDLLRYSSANFAILGRGTETRFNRSGDAILKDTGKTLGL